MNQEFEKWCKKVGAFSEPESMLKKAWNASRKATIEEVLKDMNDCNGVTKFIYANTLYGIIKNKLDERKDFYAGVITIDEAKKDSEL